MDPQQRLLLEVAWEALQDAGLKPDQSDRTRSAAYVGCSLAEYLSLSTSRLRERKMSGRTVWHRPRYQSTHSAPGQHWRHAPAGRHDEHERFGGHSIL